MVFLSAGLMASVAACALPSFYSDPKLKLFEDALRLVTVANQ
jgi:hypothetical protein